MTQVKSLARVLFDTNERVYGIRVFRWFSRSFSAKLRFADPTELLRFEEGETDSIPKARYVAAAGIALTASTIVVSLALLPAAFSSVFGGPDVLRVNAEEQWVSIGGVWALIAFQLWAPWAAYRRGSENVWEIERLVNASDDQNPNNFEIAKSFVKLRKHVWQAPLPVTVMAAAIIYGLITLDAQAGTVVPQIALYSVLGFLAGNGVYWLIGCAYRVKQVSRLDGLAVYPHNPANTPGVRHLGLMFMVAGIIAIIGALIVLWMAQWLTRDGDGADRVKDVVALVTVASVWVVWVVPQWALYRIISQAKGKTLGKLDKEHASRWTSKTEETDDHGSQPGLLFNSVESTPNSAIQIAEGFAGVVTIIAAVYTLAADFSPITELFDLFRT